MRDETRQPWRYGNWSLRDAIGAAGLFVATAPVVLWQNAHLVVLWDLSYVLDTAARIAAGQAPYRDFPLAHAPLTFLIQAALIRLAGRVFFHHAMYAAVVGGLGTVLAWRIVLHTLRGRIAAAWSLSLLLAAPLTVLGIYCILPLPSYDCDCVFWILVAVLLLQRLTPHVGLSPRRTTRLRGFVAGAAATVPLFFKQNIGLALLAATIAAVLLLLAVGFIRRAHASLPLPAVLAGMAATLLAAGLLLHFTVGLGNYVHWTIQFAAERRLPGLRDMAGVYRETGLMWMLPCVAAGLALLCVRVAKSRWAQLAAVALLAAPFVWTVFSLYLYDDADERGDSLLALWPLLLILSAALTLFNLSRGLSLRALVPVILLATIHGTMMSQQLWGSTYAIWPLLILLLAEMVAFLATVRQGVLRRGLVAALTVVIAGILLVCGGLYMASEERLSYVQLPEGPVLHSAAPELAGMATPGPYLPEFDELLRFAAANIPFSDGLILIPGEDPFYFATGRVPQFPLLLFDPATDPYRPAELVELSRSRGIRWLIVKRDLQIKEDPTPQREAVLKALLGEFTVYRRLQGYDVYQRP